MGRRHGYFSWNTKMIQNLQSLLHYRQIGITTHDNTYHSSLGRLIGLRAGLHLTYSLPMSLR